MPENNSHVCDVVEKLSTQGSEAIRLQLGRTHDSGEDPIPYMLGLLNGITGTPGDVLSIGENESLEDKGFKTTICGINLVITYNLGDKTFYFEIRNREFSHKATY